MDEFVINSKKQNFMCFNKYLQFIGWLCLCIFFSISGTSQTLVNAYANVSNVSGKLLNVDNVDESNDSFEIGDYVIVMQMQDDVLGDTSNTSSFGNLGSIRSAGLYETFRISAISESGGLPSTITLNADPNVSFNTGTAASVQIISFPELGSPNYSTTSDMAAKPWDGTTGGIIAFQVAGTLTLAHDISAEASGFRGAEDDVNATGGGCQDAVWKSRWTIHAKKGEGLYKHSIGTIEAAKGKLINAGGGGAAHNGGGGGGGNYSAGGTGGLGWGCQHETSRSVGGIGGLDLSAHINEDRIFMGGGGGAGERNNGHSTGGGNGGGIILIKANEIATSGSCGSLKISANGETTPDIGNDGAGGAGAGGSIVIETNIWNVASGCTVDLESNGGDGGSSLSGGIHGGGGGGGQGTILFSILEPTLNTTVSTVPGNGGCGNTSSPCNSLADNGTGSPGDGIIESVSGPLPVELLSFDLSTSNGIVTSNWTTLSEINNDFFNIEKSKDGLEWTVVERISGAGTFNGTVNYESLDLNPFSGKSYYRLKQVDFDGTQKIYSPKSVTINVFDNIQIYPNPADNELNVVFENDHSFEIKIIDSKGAHIEAKLVSNGFTKIIDLSTIESGIYFVNIYDEGNSYMKRFVVK